MHLLHEADAGIFLTYTLARHIDQALTGCRREMKLSDGEYSNLKFVMRTLRFGNQKSVMDMALLGHHTLPLVSTCPGY